MSRRCRCGRPAEVANPNILDFQCWDHWRALTDWLAENRDKFADEWPGLTA